MGTPDAAESPEGDDVGPLSVARRELVPMIERQLRGAMRRQGVDAKSAEVVRMAKCLCSVAAVDQAGVFIPPRCNTKAPMAAISNQSCSSAQVG